MKTEIIRINPDNLTDKAEADKLSYAADILKNGGLVAFPTETVYGLGANALDEKAVKGIYSAKGRPSDNPLIVHISDRNGLDRLVSEIPPIAEELAKTFWPGPLTLVMNKSELIPQIISAGLNTVAVRMPSHPVARELIRMSGVPVAAPSANSSGKPSPTCAGHVVEDLSGKVDVIIDGGNVHVGLESTVLDITHLPPVILRPGGVTPAQLTALVGYVEIGRSLVEDGFDSAEVPMAPGMKYRHYAPKAIMTVVTGPLESIVHEICRRSAEYSLSGAKTAILATDETIGCYVNLTDCETVSMGSRGNPETIALSLFKLLRHFDRRGVQYILAEAIDADGVGLAVMNRMLKAAGYNIINME